MLSYGDSKTYRNEWQPALSRLVPSLQFGPAAIAGMGVLARSGTPITDMATTIDADLAAMVTTYSCRGALEYVLVSEIPYAGYDGPAYQAALEQVLDALHTKYAASTVYVSRTWRVGFDAEADDWATRIGVVVAARSAFAELGDDERVWLKGADNGATMTSDGTHYSAAGITEKANQMKTVMGY